jgi:hypothetical protein
MKVWLSFLESFNGKAYFPESEWSDNEILELYTDSAIMLFCNVYNINGRISAMTRLDLEVCVFTISTKAQLWM